MHKGFFATGAALAALAVILGAFGAHTLKEMVPPESVSTFQTGVQYQFYHAIGLIIVALAFEKLPSKWVNWSARFFISGIILFSGSLYLLVALKATNSVGLSGLGIITPFGGLFFIAGWLLLVYAAIKETSSAGD